MFDYPKTAELNRIVPKARLFAHSKPNSATRERINSHVAEILWRYKLSPETTNLKAAPELPEFQVFQLNLKPSPISDPQLRAILWTLDRAIPSPIFFEIRHDADTRFATAYKSPNSKITVKDYFNTPWLPVLSLPKLHPLPLLLTLQSLYEQIFRRHLPIEPRAGESLSDQIQRAKQLQATRAERDRLAKRLAVEPQFNRKLELNQKLRVVIATTQSLID